jgi:HEAT repeat protein
MYTKAADSKLEERARSAYVNGLWRKPNPALAPKLLPLLSGNAPSGVMLAAALAIGYSGNPACDDELVKLLDNAEARRYAAIAAVLGGNDATTRKLLEVLPTDRDAEEIMRTAVNSNENDNFNLLLEPMFQSGQVYRRMRVAQLLRDGNTLSTASYSYAYAQLGTRLVAGWEGPGGMLPRTIRAELYKELTTGNPERRHLVADMLVGMNMRGLLLAARDAGVKEAREAVLNMDRPRS